MATRYLTKAEKDYEVASFAEYREDPENYRTSHLGERDGLGGAGWIDPEVLPLVDALNAFAGVCTVQSCCGHSVPTEDGEWVHNGQLWLRLSKRVSENVDRNIRDLLRYSQIVLVEKLYSYQGMTEPHEVLDIQWEHDALVDAGAIILGFFRACL